MNLQASDKLTGLQKRTHIKKGFYTGRVIEIRPKKNESQFGNKLVFLFEIIDNTLKGSDGKFPVLAMEAYYQYKQKDGSFKTAITPNSRLTKLLECLGWKFHSGSMDTDSLLGNEVEVLVEDYLYDFAEEDGRVEKCMGSVIRDVSPSRSYVVVEEAVLP